MKARVRCAIIFPEGIGVRLPVHGLHRSRRRGDSSVVGNVFVVPFEFPLVPACKPPLGVHWSGASALRDEELPGLGPCEGRTERRLTLCGPEGGPQEAEDPRIRDIDTHGRIPASLTIDLHKDPDLPITVQRVEVAEDLLIKEAVEGVAGEGFFRLA
jgi:hypothetical protein